jgi:hypothetical protein
LCVGARRAQVLRCGDAARERRVDRRYFSARRIGWHLRTPLANCVGRV